MDCLLRLKTPVSNKFSFTIYDCSGSYICKIQCKDSSAGWTHPFKLSLRNVNNDVQLLEIDKSTDSTINIPIQPYISLTKQPLRKFWFIPPQIFQTWRDENRTPEMLAAQKTFQEQQGYIYRCFTDAQCYSFLETEYGEKYKKAYALLAPGAYRADFWRYCMLYKFGGVYADAKTTLFRPLDEILRPQDELVLVRDIPSKCLLNGFFACRPRHPLLKIVIDMVLERIEGREYGEDPLDITGPHIFGKAFCRWRGQKDDSMTLTPGYTSTIQILGRSEDKLYIISPEGENLMQKEYPSYYTNDIDVKFHYPQLWHMRAVYVDQPPYNITI
jgi:hypothetical protein